MVNPLSDRRHALLLASLPLFAQQGPGYGRGSSSGSGPMSGYAPKVDVANSSTVLDVVSLKGGPGIGMPTLTVKVRGKGES